MIRNRQNQNGFTLVEAILAMTIMAIAVSGILSTFSSALIATKVAEDFSKASIMMNELRGQVRANLLSPMDINEGTSTLFPRFQWSATYQETEITSLYEVTLQIQWQQGNRTFTLKNMTYHYIDITSNLSDPTASSQEPSS